MRNKLKIKVKEKSKKVFAVYMVLTLVFEIAFPSVSMALTSGPSQPEVQSFEPVGTSQMVDPFSGDFTYNIPLLDVDGYPVNISYHSGITMDQEASWMGLGWNINPGVINRGMRGIPDDFNGENIVKEFNMKPNKTFGLTLGAGKEIVGDDIVSGGYGYDLTVRFNNYTGVGIDQGVTGHISLGKPGGSAFTGSLGLTSSSDNGLTIQPNISFSAHMKSGDDHAKLGLSIGTSFNSRAGLQHLTMGLSIQGSANGIGSNRSFSSSFNFGMPTYTPQLTLPFSNYSISGSFKMGGEEEGVNTYGRIAGFYSCQKLTQNTTSHPAYGYLNADEGVKYDNAVMDFNREKDAPFSPSTPALAVPNFTYDLLSVSGQGISGSYRPFRSDFGQVFDPYVANTSASTSIGAELGLGSIVKVGIDVSISDVTSQSGRWDNSDGSNGAHGTNHYTQTKSDPAYERFYYKEANEKSVDADPSYLQSAGGSNAERYSLNQVSNFNTMVSSNFASGGGASGTRNAREKRSQNISMLTRGEIKNKYGLMLKDSNLYSGAPSYHTAEITSTTPDGKRYVYGIAAYNTRQEETTFAVGKDEFGNGGNLSSLNCNNGLIGYNPGDNSLSNSLGIDNYLSNTILPPYAHSYFLTAVLSADYVDSDSIQGPSINDLGTYTKFNYKKVDSTYKWRTPFESNKASHNEGLKWTLQDDKANYVYGEKELWYLSSIETKNYIAVFSLENREDGYGVLGKNGGRDASHPTKLLRKISLYTHTNFDAHAANSSIALIPIKEIHFKYDYSLCPGISNSSNFPTGGKLTLKEISFSYQGSSKARLSPYKFVYGYNPGYNIKGYDRWGNYKPQDTNVSSHPGGCNPDSTGLSNAEYPYTIQDTTSENQYAQAWSLDTVKLPSGGAINIDYESDDYAYVQNKKAGQMFKIVGVCDGSFSTLSSTSSDLEDNYLKVKLKTALTSSNKKAEFKTKYLDGLDYIYFRFLYEMAPGTYEYVPGYIPISKLISTGDYKVDGTGQYGFLHFDKVHINDATSSHSICPITKAALQYGRLNEPKNVWGAIGGMNSNSSFGLQLLKDFIQSSFVIDIKDALQGPNNALYSSPHNCCKSFIPTKSWVRLNNPDGHKLGGGCRVKRISISDEWSNMTGGTMSQFSYGQEYSYNNEDGTSSGVASYEPQLGGEENSWHTPIFFDITHLLAPNDENYMEEPFGEAFFPSPSVGYSRVTVKNIKYNGVNKHATGEIVHEFWTAKDFPTITSRTELQAIREKTDPLSITSFLNIDVKDYMTASQGFYVELNDMHGKPKGQKVYQENILDPISSIEYDYKKTPYGNGSFRLDNSAQVVSPTGGVSMKNVGTFFDFITDFRQFNSNTTGSSTNFNIDVIWMSTFVIPIFTVWPSFSSEDTRFRSTASTKVTQRFGLLEKTIAKDLGSTVETDNLAYDSETGDVILTKTTTDYNDQIYTLNYPAYWYYDGMGPAYKNTGISIPNTTFTSGVATISNASNYFAPGDEIEMDTITSVSHYKAWVLSVTSNTIKVEKKSGTNPSGIYNIKIIRSGRRNMQSDNMASLITLQNPINGISNNVYQQVIQASGTEYNEQWSIFCDCISSYGGSDPSASYVTGAKGNWRKKRSFAYLTGRTQSNYDNNTNTRKDGIYTSYNSLYKKSGAKWQLDTTNWTFTSKVTIVNPNGQELENQDPLGRYSAATYGYNQTFATAVSANARYKEIGFDNAEDYSLHNCADKHFKFASPSIDSTQSHTGRKSIRVSASTPIEMAQVLKVVDCSTESPCQINISKTPTSYVYAIIQNYIFSGAGAVAPLTISWVITSGSPVITSVTGGINVSGVSSGSHWGAIVTVTGASGCSQKFFIPGN